MHNWHTLSTVVYAITPYRRGANINMSDLTLNQIQALRREGLGAAEISEQLGIDPALVAAVADEGASVRVSAEVAREMLDGIVELARGAESELVRYNARRYVVDDFKGRLDKTGPGVNVNVNIAEINAGLTRSRSRIRDKALAAAGVLAERVEAVQREAAAVDVEVDESGEALNL